MPNPGLKPVAGFVLAGGRSSRMGRDKALIEFNGEPMLVRTARQVQKAAVTATIIGSPDRYGHFGLEVIPDREPGLGPLGGIETALSLGRASWNLVVACDMPDLEPSLLKALVDRAVNSLADAVIARTSRPEPLCAVYSLSCAAHFGACIERGSLKMMEALEGLRIAWHPLENRHELTNLNTPMDLGAFLG
jgi:molybdopterin-guanine dinucleotide biosynthesis protein A